MSRAFLVLAALCACGDNLAAPPDAAPVIPPDAETYPAFPPPIPQVSPGSGRVMAAGVRVVPVFFPNDPLRDQLVAALGKLASSAEWPLIGDEYGFGAMTVATPVDVPTAPNATVDDTEIQTFLTGALDGTHPEWGPTDAATFASSIYLLYYPSTTTITDFGGASCSSFGGYHSTIGSGTTGGIIYAVMPRCRTGSIFADDLSQLFSYTSHELDEAASDPYLDAYHGIHEDDFAWSLVMHGSEIGDMCQVLPDDFLTPADIGVEIQRIWSNREAAAFHDPCLPHPDNAEPYVAAIPDRPDIVHAGTGATTLAMLGANVPAGGTKTIAVRLASEAPTPPWGVQIVYAGSGTSPVQFQLDRALGVNGDVLQLQLTATGGAVGDLVPYVLISTLGRRQTIWPGVAGITAP
jgi:hypothetical protein